MELSKTMVCRVCGLRKELKEFRSLKKMVGRSVKKCLCKPCQKQFLLYEKYHPNPCFEMKLE